jgi:hypothetical protein
MLSRWPGQSGVLEFVSPPAPREVERTGLLPKGASDTDRAGAPSSRSFFMFAARRLNLVGPAVI